VCALWIVSFLSSFSLLVTEKEIARFQAEKEQQENSQTKNLLKSKADEFLDKYAKFFDVETTKADMKKDLNTKSQSQSLFTVCYSAPLTFSFVASLKGATSWKER
jgi:uncharacterized small protein (DUF1192 family)